MRQKGVTYKKVQIWMPEKLWEDFREAAKPVPMSRLIETWARIHIKAKRTPLAKLIEDEMKKSMKE